MEVLRLPSVSGFSGPFLNFLGCKYLIGYWNEIEVLSEDILLLCQNALKALFKSWCWVLSDAFLVSVDLTFFSSFYLLMWVIILAFLLVLCQGWDLDYARYFKWLTRFLSFPSALELSKWHRKWLSLKAWRYLPGKPPGPCEV